MRGLARLKPMAFTCLMVIGYCCVAQAQNYPEKPIHIVVPYTPGGPSDIVARVYAAGLSQDLGQPVIVENRPGASGVVGHNIVAKSAPDGYTLIVSVFSDVVTASIGAKLPYDFAKDFQPISGLAATPFILVVHPSVPAGSLNELVAYAKANPGKLSYATAGIGGGAHLATEFFALRTGTKFLHVPYPGVVPASTDVFAGYINMMFMNANTAAEPIRAGQVRAIGVSTARRTSVAPDVPTLAELGIANFDVQTWNGLQAPAGTPMAIVNKLADEARKIMLDPTNSAKLIATGSEPIPSSPPEFSAYIKDEIVKWREVAKAAGIHPSEQ